MVLFLSTVQEKCEVQPIHCWGSASAIEALQNSLWKEKRIIHPKQHVPSFLISCWARTTLTQFEQRSINMVYWSVYSCAIWGPNVHYECTLSMWADSFSSCWGLLISPCIMQILAFFLNFLEFSELHISAITVPGVPLSHSFNIFQKNLPEGSPWILCLLYSFDVFSSVLLLLHFNLKYIVCLFCFTILCFPK